MVRGGGSSVMNNEKQRSLFGSSELSERVAEFITTLLNEQRQPSARELLGEIERELGLEARWDLLAVISSLTADHDLTRVNREYLTSLVEEGSLTEALRGEGAPDHEIVSTIDILVRQGEQYRSSDAFKEMVEFMGRFRDYAPYNNMLVHVQNPSCSFYATDKDWFDKFGRTLKEDARPMLILAPMHPVMLVYDIDQTEGQELPRDLLNFSHFEGAWQPALLSRLQKNAERHCIRVDYKNLSSTNSGFATFERSSGNWKMRIAIHDELDELDELDEPSRFGVLCHELAHIFLGHLGADRDRWWPGRANLTHATVEIEAESVAYIVTTHVGLEGSSAAYVSGHLKGGNVPPSVSIDSIAKVAGRIKRMALGLMPKPRVRQKASS